ERPPLFFVTAEREHLLELVDDEQARVSRVGKFGERPPARGEELRAKCAIAPPKFGHDARANERRFPGTRRAYDRQERIVIEATDEVLHELLAAEEDIRVVGLERDESLVGARYIGGRTRVIGEPGRPEWLRLQPRRRGAPR